MQDVWDNQLDSLTPMMKSYLEIKQEHSDCIVFFRLGDFYEMFFDDAILVSRQLELTLNGTAIEETVIGRATGTSNIAGMKDLGQCCAEDFHTMFL